MSGSRRFVAVVTVWLVGAGACYGLWPRLHPKLKDGTVKIRTALILPPRVDLVKVGVRGPEGMQEASEKLSATLYELLSAELVARGVQVLPNPAAAPTDAVKYGIADLQSRYDNVGVQFRKHLEDIEKGKYTLGDRVATLEPARTADVLVFVRAKGKNLSKMFWATGPLIATAAGAFQTDFGFIDARSGDVLGFFGTTVFKNPTVNPEERFPQGIREALREAPFPIPAPKK